MSFFAGVVSLLGNKDASLIDQLAAALAILHEFLKSNPSWLMAILDIECLLLTSN